MPEALAAETDPLGIQVLIVELDAFRTSLFGSGSLSPDTIADHTGTVGTTRVYAEGGDGGQTGDPAKAATPSWSGGGTAAPAPSGVPNRPQARGLSGPVTTCRGRDSGVAAGPLSMRAESSVGALRAAAPVLARRRTVGGRRPGRPGRTGAGIPFRFVLVGRCGGGCEAIYRLKRAASVPGPSPPLLLTRMLGVALAGFVRRLARERSAGPW